jgi:CRP-like cAMP-binding protein
LGRTIVEFKNKQRIFSQGDPADSVFYIQKGRVRLSVLSARGKEATLALLNPGEFLGEDSIEGGTVSWGRQREQLRSLRNVTIQLLPSNSVIEAAVKKATPHRGVCPTMTSRIAQYGQF